MRIIVCGGRGYTDYLAVSNSLLNVWLEHDRPPITIVHGGARGADNLADRVAVAQDFPLEVFPANWAKYGKGAGFVRNQEMVDAGADLLIAFPGGNGTADCVSRAEKAGIPVRREG